MVCDDLVHRPEDSVSDFRRINYRKRVEKGLCVCKRFLFGLTIPVLDKKRLREELAYFVCWHELHLSVCLDVPFCFVFKPHIFFSSLVRLKRTSCCQKTTTPIFWLAVVFTNTCSLRKKLPANTLKHVTIEPQGSHKAAEKPLFQGCLHTIHFVLHLLPEKKKKMGTRVRTEKTKHMDRAFPLNVRVGPRGGIQRKSKTGHWYYSKRLPAGCDSSCAKNIRALSMKRKKGNTHDMLKKKKKSSNNNKKKGPFTIHIKATVVSYRILIESTSREAFYVTLNKEFRARHGIEKSWHARTVWRLDQHDGPREFTCVYTIHMPDISFTKSVPKATRRWMRAYIKDLLCHEREHVELGRHVMTAVPFSRETDVREAWRKHNMAQRAFDVRSRHGCNTPQSHKTPFGTFQGECSISCRE
jgi:hypothetical protein